MARCLVTGHKGYIGSKLFKALQDAGHSVLGIDLEIEIVILYIIIQMVKRIFHWVIILCIQHQILIMLSH